LAAAIGGFDKMEAINREKAGLLYRAIGDSGFYRGIAEKGSRSVMNVTFRLPTGDLEKQFVEQAFGHGLVGLEGHRWVGGCRGSIYHATTLEAVRALVDFMDAFVRKNGF
jgi:phosphoserine aminotransferase